MSNPQPIPNSFNSNMHPLFGLCWSSRILWYASLEAVLEFTWDTLHVAHTSSTSGLSPLCLLAPVVCAVLAGIFPIAFALRSNLRRKSFGADVHCLILAAGYPHEEHVCFWMWRDRRPEEPEVSSGSSYFPLVFASSNSTSISTSTSSLELILLTAASAQGVRLVVALSETGSSLRCDFVSLVDSQLISFRGSYSFWIRNCAE